MNTVILTVQFFFLPQGDIIIYAMLCVAISSKLNFSLLKGAGAFINQGNNETCNSQKINHIRFRKLLKCPRCTKPLSKVREAIAIALKRDTLANLAACKLCMDGEG